MPLVNYLFKLSIVLSSELRITKKDNQIVNLVKIINDEQKNAPHVEKRRGEGEGRGGKGGKDGK